MNGDPLDRAIDQVARRLTQVEDDAQFASRVIAALPDRYTWFGWLTHSWAPRLAVIGIVAIGAVLMSGRRTTEPPAQSNVLASVATVSEWSALVRSANREPLQRNRTQFVEPVELLEHVEPFHGLPSIDAPKALAVNDVAPEALVEEGSLSVPSLVIADLPLTAESFSQQ